jgi:hypothetical protein
VPIDTILNDLEAGEEPVLLTALRDQTYLPRPRGRKLDKSVPFRWAKRGSDGVKLEVIRTPTGLTTTRSAVLRFFAALTGGIAPAPPRTARRREREIGRAERELQEAGI